MLSSSPYQTTPSTQLSQLPQPTVFIAHAHEDRETIAIPLRDMLMREGKKVFVQETDMTPNAEERNLMLAAMESAEIAVIVLSPQFIARKWTMKILMRFWQRREQGNQGSKEIPFVLPFFHRLVTPQLYEDQCLLHRMDSDYACMISRYSDRVTNGEPDVDSDKIKEMVQKLENIPKVKTSYRDTPGSLQEICDKIQRFYMIKEPRAGIFRSSFPPECSSSVRPFLGLDRRNEDGDPVTAGGWVKKRLLDARYDSLGVTVTHGGAGMGKSTILHALSVDDQIRKSFRDGIHVIQLGKDASNVTFFNQLCQTLRASGAEIIERTLRVQNDLEKVLCVFESWFDGKNCAFFIDDVWTHKIGVGFLYRLFFIGRKGTKNRVLVSTTQRDITSFAPPEKIVHLDIQEPAGSVAKHILLSQADQCPGTSESDAIQGILEICCGLPLSLVIAGKTVKAMSTATPRSTGKVWKTYLSQLSNNQEILQQQNGSSYENHSAIFATAIRLLDERPREELLGFQSKLSFTEIVHRLCALEIRESVPNTTLKRLWETDSDENVEAIAMVLFESGLASQKVVRIEGKHVSHLSLHDMLHDFIVAEAKHTGDTKRVHDVLLKNYSSCVPDISYESGGTSIWWSQKLEPDGYIHRNVCRHLLEAGRSLELFQLLLSPQWTERQLRVNGLIYLEADFSLGIQAVREEMKNASDDECSGMEEALGLISEAVELTCPYVSKNFRELWFQVHGRLKVFEDEFKVIGEYLHRVERIPARPLTICENSFLTTPSVSKARKISVGVPIHCMTRLKDEALVVCGCNNGLIFVFNPLRNEFEMAWKVHDQPITALAAGKASTVIVSGSEDGTIVISDLATGKFLTRFKGHPRCVCSVELMEDDKQVVSSFLGGKVQIWERLRERVVLSPLVRTWSSFLGIAVAGHTSSVLSTGFDGYKSVFILWSSTSGEQLGAAFRGHERPVGCFAVTPDGQRIVSGSMDNTLRIWDVHTHKQIGHSFEGHSLTVECVAVSGDGRRIVSGSEDKTVRVWDIETQKEICDPLEGHTDIVCSVLFLSGDEFIVSCSRDGTLRTWDKSQLKARGVRNHYRSKIMSVCFTSDSKFVVSVSHDCELRIWDPISGQQLGGAMKIHSSTVNDATVTAAGLVVSVSDNRRVQICDIHSRAGPRILTGHNDGVQSVAVTPKGDRAISGSLDKTCRIWDLTTQDNKCEVLQHNTAVTRVFVTDDGSRMISIDREHAISVWELRTLKLVKELTVKDASRMSRREVLGLVGERTVRDTTQISIPLQGRGIWYGEGNDKQLLATTESDILSWALSSDQKKICLGLLSGKVGFMKLLSS